MGKASLGKVLKSTLPYEPLPSVAQSKYDSALCVTVWRSPPSAYSSMTTGQVLGPVRAPSAWVVNPTPLQKGSASVQAPCV